MYKQIYILRIHYNNYSLFYLIWT